jgi:pyridinium-3,5-bisthiocarboxylic acid mononucleotide nickel chelatase
MNIIYFDPIMGISGDMTISALVDAGCPFSMLLDLLRQLPVELPSITAEKKRQGAVQGTYLRIGHSHAHFAVKEMRELIGNLQAQDRVKTDALAILEIIVDAEAKAHGVPREEVHFHELSHIDTIIDVVSVAQAMAHFNADKVLSGPAPHGRGLVKTAHGPMPNPPPATANILSDFEVVFLDEEGELTTPTGAAILKYYVKNRVRVPFRMISHGYGFGTRESAKPNVLRVFIGEAPDAAANEEVWVAEADMDDIEIEYVGAIAERLKGMGALDVVYFPVQMKKGRWGIRLSVTATATTLARLIEAILAETSTFGLRYRPEFRRVLERREETKETSFGPVRVKIGYDAAGRALKEHIEFEDVKRVADERGIPYRELLDVLKKEL